MGKISQIFNFDNIGQKIKDVTKWSCWITILLIWGGSAISFFVLIADDYTAEMCWIPLAAALFGPFFVWLSSWAMYGFGELIDKTCAIESNTRGGAKAPVEQTNVDDERIRKIEALRAQGLITEEEYRQAISK